MRDLYTCAKKINKNLIPKNPDLENFLLLYIRFETSAHQFIENDQSL